MANNIVTSYDAKIHNREDLGDTIWNIAPHDTFLLDNAKKTSASNNLHEWLHDSLPTPSLTNAVVEGTDAVTQAQTAVSRIGNYTQNLQKVFAVSDGQKASDEAGLTELARLTYNNQKAIKLDAEATLLERTSGAVGDTSTARTMKGVAGFIVTNALCGTGGSVVAGSGASTFTNPTVTAGTARPLTEALLTQGMQQSFVKGGKVTTLLVSPLGKMTVSGFNARVAKMQNVADDSKVYHTAIDVYDSDFGPISIVPSIVLAQVSSTNAYGLDLTKFAVAEKQSIGMEKLARTGTYDKYMINWELTLESRAEEASFVIRDLSGY
ncbi:hypothetical protein AWB76_00938 [Caballeronia temeraria]|uniref:Uncharacterized protein n=1 Tax=Caballeronia temeraria TaxID=1777137 RepID=A0A157ZM87_9BURK|nr:DUF5309 family protein [Caballeronia temeraria]SAK46579.1 hypothetical protein AWB76_00938 [Caballeronia temeraria]